MTPAINLAKQKGIQHRIHQYEHDPGCQAYGLEAVEKLSLPAEQVFKTLLVNLSGGKTGLAVAVIPVAQSLSMKLVAKALGAQKADMANPDDAQRAICSAASAHWGRKKPWAPLNNSVPALDCQRALGHEAGLPL